MADGTTETVTVTGQLDPVTAEPDPRVLLRAVGVVAALAAVVLLGLSLRLVFGSVSALLTEVRQGYHLDSAGAALLTTGPVVCLGLFGPLAARAVRRWTVPTVLAGALSLVAAGTALRGIPLWAALVAGTLAAGVGIAVANVLGPVLVRLLFPHRIGVMTGLFTALVSASAGIAAGASVPIADRILHDWRTTLSAWAIPALLAAAALAVVAVRYRRFCRTRVVSTEPPPRWQPEVLRSRTAWAVTGFMGVQSLLAYSLIAWLPSIYRERGVAAERSGLLLTVLSISSILTALTVPVVAARLRRQRLLAIAVVGLSGAGLLGVLAGGVGGAVAWAVLLGLGQGGQLSLALTLVNLRAATASMTTSLSTMAQSIGYLVAAVGPVATGAIRGATGSWTPALLMLLLLMMPLGICGWIGGTATPGLRAG